MPITSVKTSNFGNYLNFSIFKCRASLIVSLLVFSFQLCFLILPYLWLSNQRSFSLASQESVLIVPNHYLFKSIILKDNLGGLNIFIRHKQPLTSLLPVKSVSNFEIPTGHLKHWTRYLNVGSLVSLDATWDNQVPLQFCLVLDQPESYISDPYNCLVLLQSTSNFTFEYEASTTAEHVFIIETLSLKNKNPSVVPFVSSSAGRLDLGIFSNYVERKLLEQPPDILIALGNITFNLNLVQYDTSQSEDLYIGSFSETLKIFGTQMYFVLYNPSAKQIYTAIITFEKRYLELFFVVLTIQLFTLILIVWLEHISFFKNLSNLSLTRYLVPYHNSNLIHSNSFINRSDDTIKISENTDISNENNKSSEKIKGQQFLQPQNLHLSETFKSSFPTSGGISSSPPISSVVAISSSPSATHHRGPVLPRLKHPMSLKNTK